MKINWHRQHKWSGVAVSIFLVLFCISGIILNHRALWGGAEVSRSILPPFYRCSSWDQGMMRGTVALDDSVVAYGTAGAWLFSRDGTFIRDINDGLPKAQIHRNVRAIVKTAGDSLLMLTTDALYLLPPASPKWNEVKIPDVGGERLTDLTLAGDTLVLASRSQIFKAVLPRLEFTPVTLPAPADADISGSTALRTAWNLHGNLLLGAPGKIIVDVIGVVIALLAISGIVIWLMPRRIRSIARKRSGASKNAIHASATLRGWVKVHSWVGKFTIVFTVFLCFTGMLLRPPLMVPLALWKTHPKSSSENLWQDKLRMVRYDAAAREWMISTSAGFFTMSTLGSAPHRAAGAPPVSVMGLNVWMPIGQTKWLCGSLSGMYVWDRETKKSTDWFSGEPAPVKPGPPFGSRPVAGYSRDFRGEAFPIYFDAGTDRVPQPAELSTLPMPLYNVALETHTGRIYFGNSATYFFIPLIGLLALWCLLSGWKVRRPSSKRSDQSDQSDKSDKSDKSDRSDKSEAMQTKK